MRSRRESGFTLVEVLVVLAIIGVMAGIAVVGLGSADRSATAEAEARRLAASIQLAADEALIADRPAALSWDGDGYAFLVWDPAAAQWRGHEGVELAARHELAGDIVLASDDPAGPVALGDRAVPVRFTVTAGSESWRVEYDGLTAAAAPAING